MPSVSSSVGSALVETPCGASVRRSDLQASHSQPLDSGSMTYPAFGAVSVGDARPPVSTFSGIMRSPSGSLGMFIIVRASSRVIHGPPTEVWMAAACSSKLPCIFARMSNSTYSLAGAPTMGASDLVRRRWIMVSSGMSVSA